MINEISVILPVFNEKENITNLVDEIHEFISKEFAAFEILLINDGSNDGTGEVLNVIKKRYGDIVNIINHYFNAGYGAALYSGFSSAKHNYIFLMDADGQFKISDLGKLITYAEKFDIIKGYRLSRRDHFYRILMGKVYNLFIRLFFRLGVRDVNCGFQLSNKKVLAAIQVKSKGAIFPAEFLIRAKKKNFKIMEVGINHYPRISGYATGGRLKVIMSAVKELPLLFF